MMMLDFPTMWIGEDRLDVDGECPGQCDDGDCCYTEVG